MRMILYSVVTMAVIGATASGCTTDERRTAGYGVGGAAIGGLAGAAIGAAAGTLVGVAQTRNGVQYCRYRDRHGRVFEARCR